MKKRERGREKGREREGEREGGGETDRQTDRDRERAKRGGGGREIEKGGGRPHFSILLGSLLSI